LPFLLLADVLNDRAITRQSQGHFHFTAASTLLDLGEAGFLGNQGLVAEVRTGTHQGWLLLWGIPELSTDFIDLGPELGRATGAILDRRALLDAIDAGAAARTRLSLARDVHDGIVQFLAGAAFRVEAIKRASKAGAKVNAELDELKRLLVEEQGEIRGFLLALRRDHELEHVRRERSGRAAEPAVVGRLQCARRCPTGFHPDPTPVRPSADAS
jgi:signal transduction histidine kinase